mmetsp:Transcript_9942/g.11380  ORF Transcript_9942/g.11380 Transcript_9942/m.11380 type:complete len:215 (-) Transcript_9942:620-1264(-)
MYIVLDYLDGGCLMQCNIQTLIYTNPELGDVINSSVVFRYAFDIASGLQFLHERGIIHRDIKPENVLLKRTKGTSGDYSCVIADFGCAQRLENDVARSGIISSSKGTLAYFSPEACSGNSFNGYSADVWALGITLYVCSYGMLPFAAKGVANLLDLISSKDQIPEIPVSGRYVRSSVSLENMKDSKLCRLLSNVLDKSEQKRWDLKRIILDCKE